MTILRPSHTEPRPLADLVSEFHLQVWDSACEAHAVPDSLAPVLVAGVVSDNREAAPGDLFVALPGEHAHGARFAASAVAAGAVAVLTDGVGAALPEVLELATSGVPVLIAPNPRALLGPVAAWVYRNPASALLAFGVTGTNGKTTTTFQLQHLLGALGHRTGLIGTVQMRSGAHVLPGKLTTPEAGDLQAIFATMRQDGVDALAMEVSSHALAQHRVDGIRFRVVGFTNLTQDHLDFHHTMAEYFAAKAMLFTPEHAERAVILLDDVPGQRMAGLPSAVADSEPWPAARIPVATLYTGTTDTPLPPEGADWRVTDIERCGTGSAFTLSHRDGRSLRTQVTLPGGFNVANGALALTMLLEAGFGLDEITKALRAAGGLAAVVPGRMEVISSGSAAEPRVVVDFAHNTEALELAAVALGEHTGRLIIVFGATGDRDAGKRPAMGRAAVAAGDVVWVTDDDPHGEDRQQVRDAVLAGARAAVAEAAAAGRTVELREVALRRDAIHQAIAEANPADTVLIAGRGHETIQEVAGQDVALDDRVEARAALEGRSKP